MTSPTDQNAHPDVMEIADLAEDILQEDRAFQVRAHLGSCPDCAGVLASLREISGLLAEMPEPEAMPSDVVARIDAALAAEPLPASEQPDVPRETAPPAPGGSPGGVPRGTSAPAGRPAASTGPGRARRRGRRMLLTAAGAAAFLVLGGLTYELASHSGSGGMGHDSSASSAKGSNRDNAAPDALGIDVARLLDSSGSTSASGPANSPMLGTKGDVVVAAPNGTVTSVPSCVLKATQRTEKPLAAERKVYEGVDSFVVVLPDPDDTSLVSAYVLTASCSPVTPAQLLFENSYPRD
ncbi:anti-sigma factor family protein [Streptomyces sp. NPDC020983]|uniref:anti-sigma factor family protein n=1 Tax=Streptomyces sp. NPDC020983 TaxID=3365106 RepID=UPI00379A817E